ncbi:COBW domain-containing protein 1 [Entophlyctis sp. JEL0112]|nr:COBW domain-containing protein 1 [Entophlyctis sp. JEL0112]
MNEFGDSHQDGEEATEWLELNNGCMCCEVKDAGVKALESLMKKRGKFDYILLETTGLADPGPIVEMFWLDDAIQSDIYLDGIVTVVDAKFAPLHLSERKPDGTVNECIKQIAMSDRLIINKTDLVSPTDLETLENTIDQVNSSAERIKSVRSAIPVNFIFDLHAFDDRSKGWFDDLPAIHSAHDVDNCDGDNCGHSHAAPKKRTHQIDQTNDVPKSVKTIMFRLPPNCTVSMSNLESWLQEVLWNNHVPAPKNTEEQNFEGSARLQILRFKAALHVGDGKKMIIQAVHELYDKFDAGSWSAEELVESSGKLVFIGE